MFATSFPVYREFATSFPAHGEVMFTPHRWKEVNLCHFILEAPSVRHNWEGYYVWRSMTKALDAVFCGEIPGQTAGHFQRVVSTEWFQRRRS